MSKTVSKFALAAGVSLALAFTVSCSSDYGDGGDGNNITYGSVTDSRDGQTYKSVVIGTQTWMAENLNYNAEGSKCYDNVDSNCDIYGRLYGWATANALPLSCNSNDCSSQIQAKHQGVCPNDGWHIPSNEDWDVLIATVGGYDTAGTKLKAASGWNNNGNGMDEYGFSALPGGYSYSGDFHEGGSLAVYSTASEDGDSYAYYRDFPSGEKAIKGRSIKGDLRSVRCVKD